VNRPRWHKVLFDLWSHPTRSILVIASILVGLFAIGVIATLWVLISADMRVGYASTNPANIYLSTGFFSKQYVTRLRDMPGVRQAEGARFANLRLQTGPDEWTNLQLVSLPDYNETQINQVKALEGQWPPQDRQVVMEVTKLSAVDARVGESLTIELPSGGVRQLELAGVIQDQSLGAGTSGTGGFFNASMRGYVTEDTLDYLEQVYPARLNVLYVTVEDSRQDKATLEQLAVMLGDHLKENGVEVYSSSVRSSDDHPNQDLVQAMVAVLLVLGMLVVFLSGFLITNTLQALLEQQVQQVGIMKSIGARRLQIVNVYMVLILIYGLLAFAVSVPLSAQAAYRLLEFLAIQLNFSTSGLRVVPGVVVIQIVLALLVPQIAASLPIWKGTGISVQEALSGIRQGQRRSSGWIEARLADLRRFSRPIRIAIRNVFRRKGRLALTLITLTTGGAVFIGTFSVKESMQNYVDQIGRYFLADVNLILERSYRVEEIQGILGDLPGIRYVEAWASAQSQILLEDGSVGEDVQMLAPPATSELVVPVLMDGRWIQPGDRSAIVLNEMFQSRFPDLQVGDSLRLQVNGKETEWTVVGFFRFAGKVTGFLAYTEFDYLTELNGQVQQAGLYRVVMDHPKATSAEQDRLAQAIEIRLRDANVPVVEITTGSVLVEKAGGGFGILTSFLLFLAGLIALVGSISLAGTMSMNVMERTREIGILRAIGATNQVLMKMVIVEGVVIGMISWLLASLLSVPIGKIISDGITLSVFGAASQPGYPAIGFLIWLGVVIILSVLASVMPARGAARLTIREVLSYE